MEVTVGESEKIPQNSSQDASRRNSVAIVFNCMKLPEETPTDIRNTAELDAMIYAQNANLTGCGYQLYYWNRRNSAEIQKLFANLLEELRQENNLFDVLIVFIGFVRNTNVIDCYNTQIPLQQMLNDLTGKIPNAKVHAYLMLTCQLPALDSTRADTHIVDVMAPFHMEHFYNSSYSNYRRNVERLGGTLAPHFYKQLNEKVNFVFSPLPMWLGVPSPSVEDRHEGFSNQCNSYSIIVECLREGRDGQWLWSLVAKEIRSRIENLSEQVGSLTPIVNCRDDFRL